ncbi:MAG: MerR family transcriptional regulator, partial [Bifidobacterium sp.]
RRGILQPQKNASGYRNYCYTDIAWIEFIQRLLEIGMPLNQVKEYSRLRQQGDTTIPDRLKLLHQQKTLLAQQQTKITSEIDFLDRKINTYNTMLCERIRK